MKTDSLRRGNLIKHYIDEIGIVMADSISEHGISFIGAKDSAINGYSANDSFSPIDLDFQWMQRLGFAENETLLQGFIYNNVFAENEYKKVMLSLVYNNDTHIKQYYAFLQETNIRIKGTDPEDSHIVTLTNSMRYVHQLQNLFYVLTGRELTFKL